MAASYVLSFVFYCYYIIYMFVFLRQELDQLWVRIQTLEDRSKAQSELSPLSATLHEDTQAGAGLEEGEERDTGGQKKEEEDDEELGKDAEKKEREKAAFVIQTNWREHRNRVCNTPQLCKRSD